MKTYTVKDNESNQTLEKYVKKVLSEAPLSFIYKVFRKRDVKLNGKRADMKERIKAGDIVEIYVSDDKLEDFKKKTPLPNEKIKDLIIYEDDNILIVNKPKGMLVQKDEKNCVSLDQLAISYFIFNNKNIDSTFSIAPAHRIDRNTSGIVIFGKSVEVMQELLQAFKNHNNVEKHYLALVNGVVDKEGEVKLALFKNEETGIVRPGRLAEGAKSAWTIYKPIKIYHDYTLLDVQILTGRTHQIRAHLLAIDHPIIGDQKYGDFKANKEFAELYGLSSQFLHAQKVIFHNMKGKLAYLNEKEFIAELPLKESALLSKLQLY
ncbi:MAG: RluA family pseudouridine synthase [Erysipelotrichaceae bacterium]|nr:RluA family pseudouridine synthase [Erysipelotrichaceae bacterium]